MSPPQDLPGSFVFTQMGKLTTHVLDVSAGVPAKGVRIELHGPAGTLLTTAVTNEDGRAPPLLAGEDLHVGRYILTFHVADYFRARDVPLPQPPFLDQVAIAFGVADPEASYHVPLLVSPWAYSTYRGS
jgi:5-hydroxyisourate hydrolase